MPHWAVITIVVKRIAVSLSAPGHFLLLTVLFLLIYSLLVGLNVLAIQTKQFRIMAAALTGIGHLSLGLLHAYRLQYPFTFEVFGYSWTRGASLREALIVVPFGLLSFVAIAVKARGFSQLD
jgi:hypothetical protein